MAKQVMDLGGSLMAQVEARDGVTWVALGGTITEVANFAPLTTLRSPVRFDLAGIDRINSLGVRSWCQFVRQCELAGLDLTFDRCSPVIVSQISMISNFMGSRSKVRSLFAPYVCPACNAEQLQLLEVSPGVPIIVPPTIACPKCNAAMVLDELADMYVSLFKPR